MLTKLKKKSKHRFPALPLRPSAVVGVIHGKKRAIWNLESKKNLLLSIDSMHVRVNNSLSGTPFFLTCPLTVSCAATIENHIQFPCLEPKMSFGSSLSYRCTSVVAPVPASDT